ncbi:hypothetical protein FRZ67_19230 [Panacibacter ginsenosidivorans]|uniref:Uncharacterized protein n=1 Tax=Panacibacter ginsenosidivorans TaxID=1813871 RepID=A0A5B8VCT5_9BACT|nr:hypothetical protein [Panacibacter ginsenosidivorans]QEC69337.1 hypothetical protein FRZ67_19230 [Panacibacter ginsenosidivorans]
MDNNFDNLKRLLDNLKTISFINRLFAWKKIKNQLIDAAIDLQKLISNIDNQKEALTKIEAEYSSLAKDFKIAGEALIRKENEIDKLSNAVNESNAKIEKFTVDNSSQLATIKAYEEKVNSLASDNRLLIEKNTSFGAENKKLSEEAATNEEMISNLSKRKSEIEIEVVEIKKDLQSLEKNYQDANSKIENLTSENSSSGATLKAHEARINSLTSDNRLLSEKNSNLIAENKRLAEEAATSLETISSLTKRKSEMEIEFTETKGKLQTASNELGEVKKQNTQLLKDEEFRKQEHSNSVSALSQIQNQIQSERTKEIDERNATEIERLKNLKDTWNRHQESAKNIVKTICQRHTIQYIDKVPFKGDPDNTLLICDEFVIFDAKSPGGDNLSNFPNYLKDQAEKAKKYAKQENVKTDIFFIVPSNTLDYLSTFVYKFGDHNVYIISVDALEPIVLSLKKIEEYEFVDQLSPEDRENICRVLGQFAHLSKRRIQVDSFFARQFIELAYKCENDLPPDILKTVIDFEKTGKLNPPQEKRAKSIPISEIENESKKIKHEADGRGIVIEDETISELFNDIPLYKKTDQ